MNFVGYSLDLNNGCYKAVIDNTIFKKLGKMYNSESRTDIIAFPTESWKTFNIDYNITTVN